MSFLNCPHCHTQIPYGASVCTGCQAEVHYGKRFGFWHYVGLFFLALFLSALGAGHSVVSNLIFLIVLGGGS